MSNDLRSTIEDLASQFVSGVLTAMRKASLEEILEQSGSAARPARRPAPSAGGASAAPAAPKAKRGKAGRLARRSPDELAKVLDSIVELVSKHADGLRAEQIRDQLGLLSKELPRPLADGVAAGRLKKKGEKRATTYFAGAKAGGGAAKGRGRK